MKYSFIVAFCLSVSSLLAKDGLQSDLSCLVENNVKCLNGCVLVAKGEKIIFERASGLLRNPQLSDTFLIGSISKQFTAVLMLQLVEQGLIDLEVPISKYLPDLQAEWSKLVRIKHLLNHTSGITSLESSLEFKPGTQFKYSPTLTYHLCSLIAEKVTGTSFEILLCKLFQEAKLVDTSVLKDRISMAGAGIRSSLHDLLRWNLMLHRDHLLSDEFYQQMISPAINREHPRYGSVGYGFGLQIEKESLEISHSGYVEGFMATLLYYPSTEMSIIILENVSRDSSDIRQAFRFHDKVRDLIRRDYL